MSNNTKKIILGILIFIMAYIWGKNIIPYFSRPDYIETQGQNYSQKSNSIDKTNRMDFEYQRPSVNPFYRFKAAPSEKPQRQKPEQPKPLPAFPSQNYSLGGIINSSGIPQAIIKTPGGSVLYLSEGDSIDSWRLNQLQSDFIIFEYEKYRDTLGLEP